jgi:lipoprotein NlpI
MAAIKFSRIILAILLSIFFIFVFNCCGAKTAEDFFNKGKEFSKINDSDQAIKNYNQAIKLDPKMVKAYNNRGVAYVVNKQYDLAIDDFTKVIELESNHGKAYFNRAIAHWCKSDKEKARQDVQKAQALGITVDPEFIKKIQELPSPAK